jgi:hypothetical protein
MGSIVRDNYDQFIYDRFVGAKSPPKARWLRIEGWLRTQREAEAPSYVRGPHPA